MDEIQQLEKNIKELEDLVCKLSFVMKEIHDIMGKRDRNEEFEKNSEDAVRWHEVLFGGNK